MTWVDWAIVIVLAASVMGGLSQGFFRSVCSLCGLFLGLVLAAWNYGRVAALLMPMVRVEAIADAIGFLLIALLVMAMANLVGALLSKTIHGMGLGCLDRLAGGVFGLVAGRAADHAVHSGDCGVLSKGPLACGSKAAKVVFRDVPFEHAREPCRTCRPCARRSADAGTECA